MLNSKCTVAIVTVGLYCTHCAQQLCSWKCCECCMNFICFVSQYISTLIVLIFAFLTGTVCVIMIVISSRRRPATSSGQQGRKYNAVRSRNSLWNILKEEIANFSTTGHILLTGDFNACTGSLPDYVNHDSISHSHQTIWWILLSQENQRIVWSAIMAESYLIYALLVDYGY